MSITEFAQLAEKARAAGAQAWANGDSTCPYSSAALAAEWTAGWDAAQQRALGHRTEIPEADGIYTDITDELYHSDRGSLSSSGARTLLTEGGPARFRYAPRVEKDEYDYGHIAHSLILGEGSTIVVVQADSWRTKDAQQARKDARADGKVAVLDKTFRQGENLAIAAKQHPLGEVLFAEGIPEQSVYWHDDRTGARLRCRPDWTTGSDWVLQVDVKTTKSAAPRDFEKSCADYGYHQQQPFYVDGLAAHGIDSEFLFFAIEKTYPYLCSVVELPPEAVALGRSLNRNAIDLYAQCMERDEWPGYAPIIHRIDLPPWAYTAAEATIRRTERTLA